MNSLKHLRIGLLITMALSAGFLLAQSPAARQAPRVLERLTRAGFTYAVDDFVALTWREPRAAADSPFPGKALQWAMTVRAWRSDR